MKYLVLVSLFAISSTALAQTKFDHIKKLYDAARAPVSVKSVKDKIPKIKDCFLYDYQNPNVPFKMGFEIVNYTVPAEGPEFPERYLEGIGHKGAGQSRKTFFSEYKESLKSQGLEISYSYEYTVKDCDYFNDSKDCYEVDREGKNSFTLRADDKYLLFSKEKGTAGYCWF